MTNKPIRTAITFDQWMREVNHSIALRTGMTSDDLPDCCYRDWYDDGLEAKRAASQAIKAAKDEE
jgi:hypothetical protein